ncbi:VanW family protein [Tessaracoccus sp. MC1865]|uniref:VanW family protein n=1 Tax=Tessaracoccus sp. MC1865 TaxID=2760310 RepID=UPI0016043928|nr:VanW family protein [Tessaracoccus sp. MC1865]MBB1482307.1 VanW family protein [Tessaracoccus sp. MC1865]QTO38224.1 VanW family protein [Tessaracoccus sp. MC1865]
MSRASKIVIGCIIGVLILVGGAYVAAYFVAGNQVPAQAAVDGVPIGGMSPEQARAKLETEIAPKLTEPVTLSAGSVSTEIVPSEAGLGFDYEATVQAAGGGHSWNPADIYETLTGGSEVAVQRTVDEAALRSAIEAKAPEFAVEGVDATVAFDGGKIVRTPATDAQAMDVDATVETARAAFEEGKGNVAVTLVNTPAKVTDAMVDDVVKNFAEPLISGPVILTHGDVQMEIAPGSLAEAATLEVQDDEIVGTLDTATLFEQTAEARRALKLTEAQDATFTFEGGKVVVVPAVTGQELTEEAFAAAVEKAATATGEARTVPVEVETVEPEYPTAKATALGAFTVIGEFTTTYPHAAYRNNNLGQAAKSVNGTVLMPGETFSLNDTLGERTTANGYVDGYVINKGRLVKESGGGISQAATTLFNAGFFAGFKDVEHKPHSLYFDRYPAGREATVYYGSLDMRFQNNTEFPAIIQGYISPSSSSKRGSITFKIWSKPTWDKVTSTELTKSGFYTGKERTVTGDPACEPQAPIQGFTVNWERLFHKDGKVVKREPYSWKYSAGDRIICQP